MVFQRGLDWLLQRNERSAKSAALGTLVGLLMTATGGGLLYLVSGDEDMSMGVAFFGLFPASVGYATGMIGRPTDAKWPGIVLCAFLTLLSLVTLSLEGIVCVLTAIPIVAPGLFVGALLAHYQQKRWNSRGSRMLSIGGALVLLPLAQGAETRLSLPPGEHDVFTQTTLHATASEVWHKVQALDSLSGDRPLLMELGLPVPTHCTLSDEAVGAERICYFDQGKIRQRVVAWDPPRHMRLQIETTELGGRYWLGFSEAEYFLTEVEGDTTITRKTTITSTLRPRIYWQAIEAWAVQTEHEYLFDELRSRFR